MSPGGDALHLTDSAIYVVSDAGRRIIFRAARLVRQVGDRGRFCAGNNSSGNFLSVPRYIFNFQSASGRAGLHGAWIKRRRFCCRFTSPRP